MQDFCEKGVGMRNQNPPSRPSILIISSIIIICMSQYLPVISPFFLSKQALKESLKYKQMLKDMKEFWVI